MTRKSAQLVCFSVLLVAGCDSERIDKSYGHQAGSGGCAPNGTGVLGSMFEAAGHRVSAWRAMSPALEKADVIVWVPNSFEAPSNDAQAWLREWLAGQSGRTLIYVGRDYDAVPRYWGKAKSLAPVPVQPQFAAEESVTQSAFDAARGAPQQQTDWTDYGEFVATTKRTKVTTLAGPWAEEVDTRKIEIDQAQRFEPHPSISRALLSTGDGAPLVTEYMSGSYWDGGDSRTIIIENGSWVLNLPLVNHQHRKLAGKLVDSIGPPQQRVVFLESGPGGPPVLREDPSLEPKTGFALFGVWPIGLVLGQLALLGIVFALAQWPIFGVAQTGEYTSLTDFRKHVAALGTLLRETGDRAMAVATLQRYLRNGPIEYRASVTTPASVTDSPPPPA